MLIDRLQVYYGLAIRRNTGDLPGMTSEIKAGLYHSASTDDKPQHQHCPKDDSWCKFQNVKAERKQYISKTYTKGDEHEPVIRKAYELYPEYKHPKQLPGAVVKELLPTYTRLSKPELLEKCMHGLIQNPCESINSLVWQRCPKENFSERDCLDFALADAVLHFNNGKRGHCEIFPLMGLKVGVHSLSYYENSDSRRICASAKKSTEKEKKIRQAKRAKRKKLEDAYKQIEGSVYSAGAGFEDDK